MTEAQVEAAAECLFHMIWGGHSWPSELPLVNTRFRERARLILEAAEKAGE